MKKITSSLLGVLFLFSAQGLSHEGDHGPVTIQAPKGGLIQGNEEIYLEVLYSKKKISIYAYDKEVKELSSDRVNLSAQTKLPRKNFEPLALKAHKNHYSAQFDPKGSHRFTLSILIKGKHEDTLEYVIEPKN